jgi:hypothetical protein
VTDSHDPVLASIERVELQDDGRALLSSEVRDDNYLPVADAAVEAHILGPDGVSARVPMANVPGVPGEYRAEWNAEQAGDYLTEITAARSDQPLGRDVLYFRRVDGVAENFHTQQNRALLERIAALTGGRYWQAGELTQLADQIELSAAGITAQAVRELWNMPVLLLLLLLLPLTEWLVRRWWGVI